MHLFMRHPQGRRKRARALDASGVLKHRSEKWTPVFGNCDAQTKLSRIVPIPWIGTML